MNNDNNSNIDLKLERQHIELLTENIKLLTYELGELPKHLLKNFFLRHITSNRHYFLNFGKNEIDVTKVKRVTNQALINCGYSSFVLPKSKVVESHVERSNEFSINSIDSLQSNHDVNLNWQVTHCTMVLQCVMIRMNFVLTNGPKRR